MSKWQCQPILVIYVLRVFQWYKERHKPLSFDPSICSLKFWKSTGTPSPKVGVALGVRGFIPSHFLTLPGVCDVTPGLPLGPHFYNPFALVTSPKLGLQHSMTTVTMDSVATQGLKCEICAWTFRLGTDLEQHNLGLVHQTLLEAFRRWTLDKFQAFRNTVILNGCKKNKLHLKQELRGAAL